MFYWDIYQFVFLREYTCEIYRFQPGLALIIDYMIIFSWFILKENFTAVCSNRGEFNSGYPDTIFEFDRNSIFLLLLVDILGEISSQFNELEYELEISI